MQKVSWLSRPTFVKQIKQKFDDMKYRSKLVFLCILVSFLPLSVMGFFCYNQTIKLLRARELSSLESTVTSVSDSLDSKISIYQNLLSYLANSNVLAQFSSYNDANAYDQYEYLNYTMDVFLNATYLQHPEIRQITIYNADGPMTHGKQLRPISDLEGERWYAPYKISTQPTWYKKKDGSLLIIQYLCEPYLTYIRSYSKNYIAIQLNADLFFGDLDRVADNFHIQIDSPSQTLFSYKSDSILENASDFRKWVTRNDLVDSSGWNVTLERPEKMIFASVRQMGRIIIAILFFCVVVIFLITQLFTSFFEQKISALHYYLQRIKEGHLNYHIHDDSKDELGDLTNNLQAMIDEINPHFLYNCLSLINNKALMNDRPEISQMSQLLSVFYRTTLNKGKSETLLQNEIKNVTSYIDIQRLLHDNIFDVMYQIDPNLPEIEVPNLLLQPLVENSIIHGILPNKTVVNYLSLSQT